MQVPQQKSFTVYSYDANPNDEQTWSFFFLMVPPTEHSKNQPFPWPKPALPGLLTQMRKVGFRWDPDWAEIYKIPLQPGMGELDPGQWVDREAYEKYLADKNGPEAEGNRMKALEELKSLKPEFYDLIKDMNLVERKELADRLRPQAEQLLKALAEIVAETPEEESDGS